MKNHLKSTTTIIIGILLMTSLAGCGTLGIGKSAPGPQSSEISVVFTEPGGKPCTTAAQNYSMDLNGASTWHLKVHTISSTCAGTINVSLGIKSATGSGGMVTGASAAVSAGGDKIFEADLIPGTYQVLLDGQPTEVLITVNATPRPSANPTTTVAR